jgi:hypothetical protein
MKNYYSLHPSMFFLAFFLLMEEEKSSKKRKPLYKKILNKELSSDQFETLFKKFRSSLETKSIRFYETYQWFEGDNLVVFTGDPDEERNRSANFTAINPKFLVREETLEVKVVIGQANICGIDRPYFHTAQGCWPFNMYEFHIKKIRESKRYAIRFRKAIISALQSFE